MMFSLVFVEVWDALFPRQIQRLERVREQEPNQFSDTLLSFAGKAILGVQKSSGANGATTAARRPEEQAAGQWANERP